MILNHVLSAAIVALAVLAPAAAAPAPPRFYVSPEGRDTWSGQLREPNAARTDGPFAGFERARDAVRALKAKGLSAPVEVILRGGVYERDRTLRLGPEDGGTAACPVTWRAETGERVLIRGGKRVAGWQPWRDGTYVADLKAQGLEGVSFHQLFWTAATGDGPEGFCQRLVLARHPNFDPEHPRTGGFVTVEEQMAPPNEHLRYAEGALPFERWRDLSQAEVVSTYNMGWMFALTPVQEVDPQTRTITVRRVRGPFLKLNRFFIQNLLDALDAPGEWYLDRKESRLYFRPPGGDPSAGEVVVPVLDHLVEVAGTLPYAFDYLNVSFKGRREECPMPADAPPLNPVEHLAFERLDFECAEQDALRLVGARNCRVAACRVTNVGNIGINLGGVTDSFPEVGNPRRTPATGRATGGAGGGGQILLFNDPCMECRVVGCDVWSVGCEGVMLLGAANVAENNHVWDIGLYAKDAPCINLLGAANAARRNTLHDCPRCAVFLKGVENVVELNDVHHADLETCDMGAIRMVQRNVNLKGNRIRFNRVLDTVGYGFLTREATHYESPYYTWGIYLDDYTCGTEVYGNIVSRTGRGGVMVHGGGGNLIANNILVNAGAYQIEWAPMPETHPTYKDAYAGNRAERNLLVCTAPETYPHRFTSPTPHLPAFKGNLLWAGGKGPVFIKQGVQGLRGFEAWCRWSGEEGSRVADPRLAPEAGDFLPGPDSPAWAMGFEQILVARIGCYAAPERVAWPLRPGRERFREKPVLYAVPGYVAPKQRPPLAQFLGPVAEDFATDTVGAPPRHGDVMAPSPSQIVVADEIAAGGRRCLKVVDAPGLANDWLPRIFYATDFSAGTVVVSLDLYLNGRQRPSLYIDPRHYGVATPTGYVSGPMLVVRPDGSLMAKGRVLAKLPMDWWVHLELRLHLGEGAPAQSELLLSPEGAAERRLSVPHAGAGFQRLDRVVIASTSTQASVFWVDNVRIEAAEE